MSHFNQIINFAQIQNNPRNLFWEFSPKQNPNLSSSTTASDEGEVEVELNLCLSLGGIYSNAKAKPLLRSSSSAVAGDGEPDYRHHRHCRSSFLSLSRSCSVPAETNGEALNRSMAAKRRASPATESSSEIATWAAASAAKSVALGRAIDRIKTQSFQKMEGHDNVSLKSSLTKQLPTNYGFEQNRLKKARASNDKVLTNWTDVINRMPSVTTTGDGPDGKRVDGFLYKYTKGKVSIVCVCHGRFLTPTEFIRHAGGKEVDNPMRHINVCAILPL